MHFCKTVNSHIAGNLMLTKEHVLHLRLESEDLPGLKH